MLSNKFCKKKFYVTKARPKSHSEDALPYQGGRGGGVSTLIFSATQANKNNN